MADRTWRVIQWATGNVGARALRTIIEHPALELVGLYVTSAAKDGLDAGTLCGLGHDVGVHATTSVEAIMAMEADCVVYMPAYTDLDQVCWLLASGKNVVTPRGDFLHPAAMPPEDLARIEAACREGGTSIHASGSSPGFITEALPITLIAQQRRLDCLTINEYADMSSRDSAGMIFGQMGFGAAPGPFNPQMLAFVRHDFSGSLIQLAEAMHLPLDEVVADGEVGLARHDTTIAAGLIPAGTVAALRVTVSGMRAGQPLLRFRANWYCTSEIDQDWELLAGGWLVEVRGDTPLDVRITFPVPAEDYPAFTPGLTAHRVVNAIVPVCEAAPGLCTTMDLPHIVATF